MFAQMVRMESAARMSMGDYAVLRKPAVKTRASGSFGLWGIAAAAVMVALGIFVLVA